MHGFRERVIKYSFKYGVTKASNRFRISRNAIYEWRHKYDGKSWKSLVDRSHRPHHHPNEHTQREKEMILKRYPYQRAEYPGQKVQVDVKFVPSYCVTNGKQYYQYTAVDECTRWVFREMYHEHSAYSSTIIDN